MQKVLHTKAEILRASVQKNEGILEAVVGSTEVLDRAGDSIVQTGWKLATYKKTNPVVLWGHNVKEERPPIGKALKVWLSDKGKKAKLMFKVQFDLQDSFAAEIFRKVNDGFLNTVSVGFKPLEWEDLDKDDIFGGKRFLKQELLELSFVPVPANPQAVVALKGMKDKRVVPVKIEEMYAEKKVNEEITEKLAEKKDHVEEKGLHGEKPKKPKKPKKKPKKAIGKTKITEPKVLLDKTLTKEEFASLEVEAKKRGITVGVLLIEKEAKKKVISKSVIPFKDLDTVPDSEAWDGAGEVRRADTTDLRLISTWFDSSSPDIKSSYKLPHHKAMGHKAVWRGVAAAMAALLGARGGVDIPASDRRGVYNHLKRHYRQYDKPVPEFKAVENQVLAGFDEEIHALMLDREDRYAVRLIKKGIREQKKTRRDQRESGKNRIIRKYTTEELSMALKVVDLALSQVLKGSEKGGGKT